MTLTQGGRLILPSLMLKSLVVLVELTHPHARTDLRFIHGLQTTEFAKMHKFIENKKLRTNY